MSHPRITHNSCLRLRHNMVEKWKPSVVYGCFVCKECVDLYFQPPPHPYILMASCLSYQVSPFPVTVQETAAQRLKTVRLDMAQKPLVPPGYLRSPVLQPPRTPPASHCIPFLTVRHGVYRGPGWTNLDCIRNKRREPGSNVCGHRQMQ